MLLLLFPLLAVAPWIVSAQTPFGNVDEAVSELAKITGWNPLKKVEHDTMDRAALKRYLQQKIKEDIKPEEIRSEELALKKLGLVPKEFDLARSMVDLLTEQAAAFYDFKEKKLFLLEGDGSDQSMVVVHELAHALADQRFDLGKFIKKGKSDDSSLARMAVMEGQATWLMMEMATRRAGQSLKEMPPGLFDMAARQDGMTTQYPVLSAAPLYLRASLLFPYSEGLRFMHMVLRREGQAGFARVFQDPPVSSQQILHPDEYFAKRKPIDVPLPKFASEREWKTLISGSLGEFDHSILIEQHLGKERATEIAPHWRGGSAAVLEHKKDKRLVLLYASEWDSPEGARSMFQAYREVLKGKWGRMDVIQEQDDAIEGTGDDGNFRLSISGARISSVEGLLPTEALKVN